MKNMFLRVALLLVAPCAYLYALDYESWPAFKNLPPEIQNTIYKKTIKAYQRLLPPSCFIESRCITGHTDWVNSAQFNNDGSQIISASDDGTVRLWDTATGKELRIFAHNADLVMSAQFKNNGSQIVSASDDFTIRVWDTATGRLLRIIEGHTDWVNSAQFNEDESQIVSASSDKTIRLWLDIKKTLAKELDKNSYNNEFIYHLFAYKEYLKAYHPKVIQITFAGLAKFLNQRENVKETTKEQLKDAYLALDKPLQRALRTIFDTQYQTT